MRRPTNVADSERRGLRLGRPAMWWRRKFGQPQPDAENGGASRNPLTMRKVSGTMIGFSDGKNSVPVLQAGGGVAIVRR